MAERCTDFAEPEYGIGGMKYGTIGSKYGHGGRAFLAAHLGSKYEFVRFSKVTDEMILSKRLGSKYVFDKNYVKDGNAISSELVRFLLVMCSMMSWPRSSSDKS